ncbi:MAG: hypothetical protein ABIO81_12710, partial [Ginsengibacter sp.]
MNKTTETKSSPSVSNNLHIREKVSVASRLENIGEYYFSQKLREIDELNKAGKQVINLGIGSPDLPPHTDVIIFHFYT